MKNKLDKGVFILCVFALSFAMYKITEYFLNLESSTLNLSFLCIVFFGYIVDLIILKKLLLDD